MKKVRFTVPYFLKEKIKEDCESFGIREGTLGNRLISYYADKELNHTYLKGSESQTIQFNLSKKNDELYPTIIREHRVEVEAEFLRDIYLNYLNNPMYKREEIVFYETLEKLRDSLQKRRKVNITYNGEVRTVNPYLLKVDKGESRTYLFCFCEKYQDYRNYRLAKIARVNISKNDLERHNENYIKGVDKHFDPFLSYGYQVRVKLTKKGEALFERANGNRPRVIEKSREEYLLECSNRLAKVYFPQFLSEVEILEPENLRKWFQAEYKKMCEKS